MTPIKRQKQFNWFEVRKPANSTDTYYRHGVYYTKKTIVEVSVWEKCFELCIVKAEAIYTQRIWSALATDREIKIQATKFANEIFPGK